MLSEETVVKYVKLIRKTSSLYNLHLMVKTICCIYDISFPQPKGGYLKAADSLPPADRVNYIGLLKVLHLRFEELNPSKTVH